jgi:multisubunit Na+/H+ antiporter MnhB subunit
MMRRSLILDTTVRLVFDAVLVFSVYLLFAGHNQPGGGFVGGLVAAAAIALRYIAGGLDEVRPLLPFRPWTYLSAGLLLVLATATAPLLFGNAPVNHEAVEWQLALLGKVKVTSATIFDSGVYLIVVGLVLMALEGLGEDVRAEPAEPQEPGR